MVSGTLCPIIDCVMFDVDRAAAPEGPMTSVRAFLGLLKVCLIALLYPSNPVLDLIKALDGQRQVLRGPRQALRGRI